MNNYYNKKLKGLARSHRKNGTKAEIRIWCELLRNKQMMGHQFLRPRSIDNYIVDFFCKELKLIIEVDGYSHQIDEIYEKDLIKNRRLKKLGYSILRFTDKEIIENINNVEYELKGMIKEIEKSSP